MKCLVLGGSSGLGYAIAHRLATDGHDVVVISRSAPHAPLPAGCLYLECDVTNISAAASLISKYSPDEFYICAAIGIFLRDFNGDLPSDYLYRQAVNFAAPAAWLLEAARRLDRGGKIAWISSLTARVPAGQWCLYGAAKAGVEHLICSLRPAAEIRGISVTVCYPGVVATGFHERCGAPAPPANAKKADDITAELIDAVRTRERQFVASCDRSFLSEEFLASGVGNGMVGFEFPLPKEEE